MGVAILRPKAHTPRGKGCWPSPRVDWEQLPELKKRVWPTRKGEGEPCSPLSHWGSHDTKSKLFIRPWETQQGGARLHCHPLGTAQRRRQIPSRGSAAEPRKAGRQNTGDFRWFNKAKRSKSLGGRLVRLETNWQEVGQSRLSGHSAAAPF